MKRKAVFLPLALLMLSLSCQRQPPPSPASPSSHATGSLAFIGNPDRYALWYYGTPTEVGCRQPCGYCHMTPMQSGWEPSTGDPDNNVAATEVSITSAGHLLFSADLTGLGSYYLNELVNSGHFDVSADNELPQTVIDAACDYAGVAHFNQPVTLPAGTYPVINSGGGNSYFQMEGTYDSVTGWTWQFSVR